MEPNIDEERKRDRELSFPYTYRRNCFILPGGLLIICSGSISFLHQISFSPEMLSAGTNNEISRKKYMRGLCHQYILL